MGHRVTYAIRENDRVELFYSHWGALSVPEDMFWGPEYCEVFIRSNEPADGWLDDVWGEGGIALNKDQRTVTYFGGDTLGYGAIAETFDRLATALWASHDWRVQRVEGMPDVAEAVGVPREVAESDPVEPWAANIDELGQRWRQEREVCGLLWTGSEHLAFDAPVSAFITAGPSVLDHLERLPSLADVIQHDEQRPLFDYETEGTKMPLATAITAAVAFRLDERRIDIFAEWFPDDELNYNRRNVWPGWAIEKHTGGIAGHFEQLGLELPAELAMPEAEEAEPEVAEKTEDELLEEIARHLLGERQDYTELMEWVLASVEADGGEHVWVNPHATVGVPDSRPEPTRATQIFGEAVAALLRSREA